MPEVLLSKLALAERQLETAIWLFLSRKDRISAISLAGAADGIFHGLVLKAGKQPFSDYAMAIYEALEAQTPARAKYAKHINDKFNINDLKHMDAGSDDALSLDIDISALGAILKAIANHSTLVPEHPEFVKAMLQWTWLYYDGEQILEDAPPSQPAGKKVVARYETRPDKVKVIEARRAEKNGDSGEEK